MPYQEPNYEAAFAMDMTGVPGALESLHAADYPDHPDPDQHSSNSNGQDRRIHEYPLYSLDSRS